ncbi:MAG: hypothetical protein IPO12_16075 [Flavobacteriales bacterium]|nr:hypothetical protein [Flavobacteriales bacterium]
MERPVKLVRIGLVAVGCLWGSLGWCQERRDDDPAGSFAQLSAKERTRMAKQEENEANQDVEYLALMESAERHFQAQRFDDAMAVFEKARERRPLNVYPKVKIDDLRVLISKRDAALKEAEAAHEATLVPSGPTSPAPIPDPVPWSGTGAPMNEVPEVLTTPVASAAEEVAPEHTMHGTPSAERSATISVGQTAAPRAPIAQMVRDPVPVPPVQAIEQARISEAVPVDGVEEAQFKEGQAIVLQRTCRSGHLVQVYRKVDHPWGRTFYFLDGLSIQERVWTERFNDR